MTKYGIKEQIVLHYAQYTTIFYKLNKLKGTILISRIEIGQITRAHSYRMEIIPDYIMLRQKLAWSGKIFITFETFVCTS